MQKNGNQEMKSKPNQVSWDERLKKLIGEQSNTGDLSGEIYPAYYLYESVESFISSLLKEERQRVIDRVQEEMYEKDPNETDTQIMDRLWELLKELEKSKLSKDKV